jgi:hypothetical protein
VKQSKELTELYKVWNKKLKDSGFKDIETHPYKVTKQEIMRNELYECHFETCWQWFHRHKFRNKIESLVFELYCLGKSSREIEKELESQFISDWGKTTINEFIKECLKLAEIKPIRFDGAK